MKEKKTDIISNNRIFAWIALATIFILLVPLIAMQFTSEVRWTLSDFIVMGILLFGTGSIFVLVSRVTPPKYRIIIGIVFLVLLIWIWAELAVGVFTTIGS